MLTRWLTSEFVHGVLGWMTIAYALAPQFKQWHTRNSNHIPLSGLVKRIFIISSARENRADLELVQVTRIENCPEIVHFEKKVDERFVPVVQSEGTVCCFPHACADHPKTISFAAPPLASDAHHFLSHCFTPCT